MHNPSQQQALSLERLKQIQKSNKHVNNLIQNAKKMIYNEQQLSRNQKQVLEVKISIEKDHLRNVFYKIDCPDDQFRVQIVRKGGNRNQSAADGKSYVQYQQVFHKETCRNNLDEEQANEKRTKNHENSYSYMNKSQQIGQDEHQQQHNYSQNKYSSPNRQPNAKITISRYVKQQPDHYQKQQQKSSQKQVSINQNHKQNQYQIDLSSSNIHQTVFIKPSKNSKIIVNTRTELLQDESPKQMPKSYFGRKAKIYPNEQYTPSFQNYRKNRHQSMNEQMSEKSSDILEEYSSQFYQDQINISTGNNELHIISTETQEKSFAKPTAKSSIVVQKKKSPKTQLINFSQVQPKSISSYEHYKSKEKLKNSEPSTSYKEILFKNKQRLESSREKLTYQQTPKTPKSNKYELHLDKLYKKKSESKKRLYGSTFESSPKTLENSLSSTAKKYSIANSHKVPSKATNSREKNASSRKSLSISKNFTMPLSSGRKSPLHSTILKSYHSPCSKCIKCNDLSTPKQQKETLQQFYLAKKYLTPEGQQECYNFLRSQGIPEKDWGSYITEYVYRQLSRVYKEASPKQFVGDTGRM